MRPQDYSYASLKRQKPINDVEKCVKKKFYVSKGIKDKNVEGPLGNDVIPDWNCQVSFKNQDELYSSLLYTALDNEDIKLIEFLVDRGVDINTVKPGRDPFLAEFMTSKKAIYQNNVSLAQKLINAGANMNVNATLGSGKVPLITKCVSYRNERMIELLITSGANINPPCPGESCQRCSPLSFAILLRYDKIIDLLLVGGIDVNYQSCFKLPSPLHMAVKICNYKLVNLLLKLGADINAICYFFKKPAIHSAVISKKTETLQLLLKNLLLDVNIQHLKTGNTVLHFPSHSNPTSIDIVLNAYPDVNLVNKSNELPVERDIVENPEIKEAVDKIKNHLIKLWAAGFYLCDRNLEAVSGEEYNNFYVKCCNEINSMKKTKISSASHLNFHDILFITDQKFALCLESMETQILESKFHENFPSYSGMIEYKVDRAIQWLKLRESLISAVYKVFNNHVPSTIMEKIFTYFSVRELMNVEQLHEQFDSIKNSKNQIDDQL